MGLQDWLHWVAGLVAWGCRIGRVGCRIGRMGLQVAPLAGSRARHSLPGGHGPGASRAGTAQVRPQVQWQSPPRLQPAQWRMRLHLHLQRLKGHLSRSPPQRLPHAAARPACVPRHTHAGAHAHSMHTARTRHAHSMRLPRPPSRIVPKCHLHRLPDAASDAVDIACLDVDRNGRRSQHAVHELIDVRCAVLVPPSVVQRAARTVVREAGT